jgi:dynein heavy chain
MVISEALVRLDFVMQDIDSLLNSGDIPNIFNSEDFIPLFDKLGQCAKREGNLKLDKGGSYQEYYNYFTQRVQKYLHIV